MSRDILTESANDECWACDGSGYAPIFAQNPTGNRECEHCNGIG